LKQERDITAFLTKAREEKKITPEQEKAELEKLSKATVKREEGTISKADVEKAAIIRKDAALQESIKLEERIIAIKAKGLSPETEKQAIMKANIGLLEAELARTTEITAQKQAQVKLDAARQELVTEQKKSMEEKIKPTLERALYTKEELLKMPSRGWIGDPFQVSQTLVRRAQRQEEIGYRARALGRPEEAARRFAAADILRQQAPLLKPSEKPGADVAAALTTALDTTNAFQTMENHLSTIAEKIQAPDFANK
jgi:hypothetical protein